MTGQTQELIDDAAALAAADADRADRAQVDTGEVIERFGALGALRIGYEDPATDRSGYAGLLGAVSAECMSSAFSLWAHRMVIEYLRAADGFDDELAALLSGQRSGSIAMATAMQELAGVGTIPTRAVPDGDGYRVYGRIAWASNIAPGTLVVFPARVAEDPDVAEDGGQRVILAATVGDDGLSVTQVEDLLALQATRSAMLKFDGVVVPAGGIVADSLDICRARRTTHLLWQSSFALGLAGRCLQVAAEQLDGAGAVLSAQHERLRSRHSELTERAAEYARDTEAVAPADITLLRYEAARIAQDAARHESALIGGRGYVTTSGTNRRLREASFLPVQSPSEVQLIAEMEKFGIDVVDNYAI
ncbi:hypothetical protein GOHSU_55_00040 [Gordonia hirsuta DSM 44140 = NBRC 16056]|uniref:Acyl-CoA dehydrogenase n=1 Tax=Gordonia hirsuta DSM 44140 = NBRC 16056 TaxID=1121927 RepID=L7LD50_9ACTN|nr:acyl-CoA dehydrogenase family protein [Gordonia hirsuta]GAC58849.1 hypothetical protein GOHSU_55_00040 [Gordonia hirsuta DSM 44140 = NBRC 16056]